MKRKAVRRINNDIKESAINLKCWWIQATWKQILKNVPLDAQFSKWKYMAYLKGGDKK